VSAGLFSWYPAVKHKVTMAAKALPEDRAVLEHLLQTVARSIASLEPIRQQVNIVVHSAADMLERDFTGHSLFTKTFDALEQNLAGGLSSHDLLADYLEQGESVPQSAVPGQELRGLELLIAHGTANDSERERHVLLAATRVAEYRDAIDAFIDRLHRLHRKIVERLSAWTTPSAEVVRQPPQAAVVEESDAGAELNIPDLHPGPTKQAKRKKKDRIVPIVQPSASFERWAIGLDEKSCWQIFQRFGRDWQHQRPFAKLRDKGREWSFLQAFTETGGSLNRVALIKLVQPHFSSDEGPRIYNRIVKTTLSRLRIRLRKELDLNPRDDPIPWDDALDGYRMLIAVGYSVKDDQHRPQFHTREQLAT
jgi:hypothetical protein